MKDCEYYQELISRLADGELNKAEYDSVIAHIEDCPKCSAVFTVFSSLSDIISADTEPVPEELHENIMAQVRRSAIKKQNERRKPIISKPLRNVLAAAACAAVVLLAVSNLSADRKNREVMLTSEEASRMVSGEAAAAASDSTGSEEAQGAAPAVTPTPVPTPVPVQSAASEPDIYAGDMETETPSSAVQTMQPVRQPVTVVTAAPVQTETPVQNNTQPVQTAAPTAPASTEAPVQTAVPAETEAQENMLMTDSAPMQQAQEDTDTEADAETEEEASDENTGALFAAPPKMMMAVPQTNALAAPDTTEENDAEETVQPQPTASPIAVPKKKARIADKDTEEKLMKLLDGTKEKLPEKTAVLKYEIRLESAKKSTAKQLMTVLVFNDSVYYDISELPAETAAPSSSPDVSPSAVPTTTPSAAPTPTDAPVITPTSAPNATPTASPSAEPAAQTVMLKAKCSVSDFEKFIAPYLTADPTPTASAAPATVPESTEPEK